MIRTLGQHDVIIYLLDHPQSTDLSIMHWPLTAMTSSECAAV